MPILRVEIVKPASETLKPGLANVLANEAARIMGSPKGETWVRILPLDAEHYAENGVDTTNGPFPVFCTVVRYMVPKATRLEDESQAMAKAFAEHIGRPVENIHLHFLPDGRGRFAFGGNLIDKGPEGTGLVSND